MSTIPARDAHIRDALERALSLAGEPAAAHVFTALAPESARAEADAADARRRAGISLGPLDGTVVSVKDLFDMAGAVTSAGSKILRDAAPATADAPVVARMRRAGAVLIGRTNMSEFAYSGLGLNPHWGNPGNARDVTRAPGGSTSGGAVSVGLGIAALTLGTDTGGSTRIPAAFNGIVGFKPTSPRVPKEGVFPLSYTLDSVGPLGRTVEDCAAADAIMAGDEPLALPHVSLAGLRIGVPHGLLFEDTEPEVAKAFETGLVALSRAGAQVLDFPVDDLIRGMRNAYANAPIAACEAAEIHKEHLENRSGDFDRRVLARIQAGKDVPAPGYVRALHQRESLKREMAARIGDIDVLALPTCAIVAPEIAALDADDALFARTNVLALRNTSVANFFDLPALSLPLPVSGLPVGLMLVGQPFADRRVLAIGRSIEALLAAH
jgi:aspartyl-tRNA(Asn)/glutamyl-tRNA(Gln) amidotransferase subunit A